MAPLANGMKRRHFLKALGTAAVALALPTVAPSPTTLGAAHGPVVASAVGLHFHPDAFKDAAQSLADAIDREGMRIIMEGYTVGPDRDPCRFDILCGWATVSPSATARILA